MLHIFIINKKAQNYSEDLERKIHNYCKYWNLDFKIIETTSIEDIKNSVSEYKNSAAIVYAVGGDGTINVILNEIINGEAKLGILPFGTGNDFYRSLDEYRSEIIKTNVIKVNEKYGLNIFSLGIDAEICVNAEKLKKLHLPSKYLYYISTLYTYFKYKNQVIGLNDFFARVTLLAICNGAYYGGGHKIAPQAGIHTKDVYVVSVTDMPKLEMPLFWLEVLKGRHLDNPYIDLYIADKEIHVETMYELTGQLDGEPVKGNDFNVIPSFSTIEVINNRKLIKELKQKK